MYAIGNMWVARDPYGVVTLFENYPTRIKDGWFAEGNSMLIYPDTFPNLKWEDDPVEVSIIETFKLQSLRAIK